MKQYKELLYKFFVPAIFIATHSILLSSLANASLALQPNPSTLSACEAFKTRVTKEGLALLDTLEVPIDYKNASKGKMQLSYWIKPGTDKTKPPLLLIHGGPGGNSWRFYDMFKNLPYSGDIVGADIRNEGCSHVMHHKSPVENFRVFNSRFIIEDFELLRKHLYGTAGNSKWKIFGQSRGAALTYYYLEMYPNSLHSVHAHAVVGMLSSTNAESYSMLRAKAGSNASQEFEKLFPGTADLIKKIKSEFQANNVCLPVKLNQDSDPNVAAQNFCGQDLVDALGYKLTNFARWKDLASMIDALKDQNTGDVDLNKARTFFESEINGHVWVQNMNYIMGTVAMDYSNPTINALKEISTLDLGSKTTISEMNFVSKVVLPAYLQLNKMSQENEISEDKIGKMFVDFKKIKKFLSHYRNANNGHPFSWKVYVSKFDPLSSLEMRDKEITYFGDLFEIVQLSNSGHEGWATEAKIKEDLLK